MVNRRRGTAPALPRLGGPGLDSGTPRPFPRRSSPSSTPAGQGRARRGRGVFIGADHGGEDRAPARGGERTAMERLAETQSLSATYRASPVSVAPDDDRG